MWTDFYDMHSGGGQKVEPYEHLFIEAETEAEAIARFETLFERDPHNVTCHCCGADYSILSDMSLEKLTGYDRKCAYREKAYVLETAKVTLEDYLKRHDVFVERLTDRKEVTKCG